ncbi:MAG: hypothetical protein E7273_10820 [Pseudobutyrivibrio ruminis]|nr:hypothetical protein [Pseudobutyrivibrio ruminis]
MEKTKCPVCSLTAEMQPDYDDDLVFYTCPICGRFQLNGRFKHNYDKLGTYLIYHKFSGPNEYRYNTERTKEECDKYSQEFKAGKNTMGFPVHMNNEIIDSWFPKSFSEKIDLIVLFLAKRTMHLGQTISMSPKEMPSILFLDRYEKDSFTGRNLLRNEDDLNAEVSYMLDCLKEVNYIKYEEAISDEDEYTITLTPSGWNRVDELQKNTANGRNVLVAMKFGVETKKLREAIRKGINEAGYIAIFIDEVQHNDFITPELLKHIKDSKFVVVDLSHQNNGAYFEEGYAMGLGKPVIQLCEKDVRLHFDIAQKNTIIWDSEDEIPERLTNRILATID